MRHSPTGRPSGSSTTRRGLRLRIDPPGDRATVVAAIEVLSGTGKRRGLARLLPFLGPAIIASVAYVDPGNFATNLQSGSQLGYTLLWVVVA